MPPHQRSKGRLILAGEELPQEVAIALDLGVRRAHRAKQLRDCQTGSIACHTNLAECLGLDNFLI
jgi:hypothetical protein